VVELRRIALARDRLIGGLDGASTIDELRKLDRMRIGLCEEAEGVSSLVVRSLLEARNGG
jgi:hypothetical protein